MILLELAALNKWCFAPRLASATPRTASDGARGLRRLIELEALALLAIPLTTAVLSGATDLLAVPDAGPLPESQNGEGEADRGEGWPASRPADRSVRLAGTP